MLCFRSNLEDYKNESSSKTVTEREVIFYEIVAGIRRLHGKGFVHRDIKPNNIFIDYHGHAKVGDFGQSKCNSDRLVFIQLNIVII